MSDRDRDRWECVQRLFESALEREGEARERYLEEACAGDESMLGEVRSLLVADQRGHVVLDGIRLEVKPES
jgi:hypothetical protein